MKNWFRIVKFVKQRNKKNASHAVGRGFTSQPDHTKDHHRNGTNSLPGRHACVRAYV